MSLGLVARYYYSIVLLGESLRSTDVELLFIPIFLRRGAFLVDPDPCILSGEIFFPRLELERFSLVMSASPVITRMFEVAVEPIAFMASCMAWAIEPFRPPPSGAAFYRY